MPEALCPLHIQPVERSLRRHHRPHTDHNHQRQSLLNHTTRHKCLNNNRCPCTHLSNLCQCQCMLHNSLSMAVLQCHNQFISRHQLPSKRAVVV